MTSVIVPPVDLAPGMPSRVVTISATDVTEGGTSMAGQMVRFALSDTLDVTSGGDVIAKTQAEVVLDSNGEGSIRLPVYDEDVKTWCGDPDWAILVTATWGSQKAIRVPAGSSTIALSALPPVRPLRGREKQWAITGASVTVSLGSTAGGTVDLSGGVLNFNLTLPDTNPETFEAAQVYADSTTSVMQRGRNLWNPGEALDGYTISGSQSSMGEPVESSAYHMSGFIYVQAGKPYTLWSEPAPGEFRGPRVWSFYDLTQGFTEFGNDAAMAPRTLVAPADGYLRASFRKDIAAAPMIEAGNARTEYAPYQVQLPGLALSRSNLPEGGVTPDKTSFAVRGKNLLDPDEFADGLFLHSGNGGVDPLAGYTTSGMVPVVGGTSYTGVVRVWAWYSGSGGFISGTNTGSNTEVNTQVAPPGAEYMRASWQSSRTSIMQIEEGDTATEYEEFGVRIPNLIGGGQGGGSDSASGPLTITADESGMVTVASRPHDTPLTITADLHGSRNGTLNFVGATSAGATVSEGTDDIAPLRTFNTVGANHGYTCITTLTAPGHGKTRADLGSVWTDGATEWTLLLIDGDGLTVGPSYSVGSDGSVAASSSPPAGPLTHVSGATDTTSIPTDQVVSGAQLYPSVQRVHCTLLVDGAAVGEGEHHGVTAQVRESYEVLDYASIVDTAQANVGTPFYEVRVRGAVRVENVYTFKPGLVLVDTALTELRPTSLGSCGFVQAIRPAGTGGRIVPGVTGWTTPRSFEDTWTSEVITASDLIDPAIPPVMSLDVMDWGGFALGYMPWQAGVTSSQERIEHGSSNLWDLRSTKKSYPSPWAAKAAGWGRVEAHAYRAYLTPAQAATVAAEAEDAHAAHSALAAVTGL